MLDPRDRLGCDVSITVVDPESRPPSSGGGRLPSPAAVPRPPPPAATGAPLAAGGGTMSERLAREKHQLELQQLREQHQLALQQMRERHQWEAEKTRLEAEILSMRRDYWRVQLERCRAGTAPHPEVQGGDGGAPGPAGVTDAPNCWSWRGAGRGRRRTRPSWGDGRSQLLELERCRAGTAPHPAQLG